MDRKVLTITIVCLLSLAVCLDSFAQKRGSFGSSRSSFSGSSSSSKPKYGSGSGASSSTSKPKYGSGSSTGSSTPKYGSGTTSSKPKYGSGSGASSSTSKPKYGSGSGSSPSSGSNWNGSATSKQRAAAQQQSQKTFAQTQKATAPPKSSYTSPTGKTVSVNKDSKTVQTIRSRPSTDYTPQARTQRTEVHITSYGYSHPYSYYRSYDPYYVGGGYSSAYWWMMMEWDAQRRARWLYNNQNNIEQSAYEKGIQDAAVAAEIARLKAENAAVDPNYVDPEFADNPDLMYEQEYVEAAYNPTVVQPDSGPILIILTIIVIGVLLYAAYFLVFKMRFGD